MRILIILLIASLVAWFLIEYKSKTNDKSENEDSENLNVDAILDKISKKGIKSLTSRERKFLDKNK